MFYTLEQISVYKGIKCRFFTQEPFIIYEIRQDLDNIINRKKWGIDEYKQQTQSKRAPEESWNLPRLELCKTWCQLM